MFDLSSGPVSVPLVASRKRNADVSFCGSRFLAYCHEHAHALLTSDTIAVNSSPIGLFEILTMTRSMLEGDRTRCDRLAVFFSRRSMNDAAVAAFLPSENECSVACHDTPNGCCGSWPRFL